jgi:hypothetical protein
MTRFRFETRPLPALTRYYLIVRQLPISAFLSRRSLVRRRISFQLSVFQQCYFAAFCLLLASARRSVFLRRAARFLTLSLPWLFPIILQHSSFLRRFQALSLRSAFVIFHFELLASSPLQASGNVEWEDMLHYPISTMLRGGRDGSSSSWIVPSSW